MCTCVSEFNLQIFNQCCSFQPRAASSDADDDDDEDYEMIPEQPPVKLPPREPSRPAGPAPPRFTVHAVKRRRRTFTIRCLYLQASKENRWQWQQTSRTTTTRLEPTSARPNAELATAEEEGAAARTGSAVRFRSQNVASIETRD